MSEQTDVLPELTHRAAMTQLKDLADEIRRVSDKEVITEADEEYLNKLTKQFDEIDESRKAMERKALVERVSVVTKNPLKAEPGHTPKDLDDDPFGEPESVRDVKFHNPWNLDEMRRLAAPSELAGEYRARALSAIEKMSGTNDKRREAMTKIIEQADNASGSLARQLLVSSSPEYMRAFGKVLAGKNHALTAAEQRAMSLTDTSGGFLVKVAA